MSTTKEYKMQYKIKATLCSFNA